VERRTILAIVLIALVTFLWMWTGQRTAMRRSQDQATEVVSPEETAPSPEPAEQPEPSAPSLPEQVEVQATSELPLNDEIRIKDDSLKYELVWTNRGAALRRARLVDYPESLGSDRGVLLLDAPEEAAPTLSLVDPSGALPLDAVNYELLEESPQRIAFAATFPNGLRVIKEFFPHPDEYDIGVKVSFENLGATPLEAQYDIVAAGRILPEGGIQGDIKAAFGLRYPESGRISVEFKTPRKVEKKPFIQHNDPEKPLAWAGAINRYFAAILEPKNEDSKRTDSAAAVGIYPLKAADESTSFRGRVRKLDNVQTRLQLRRNVLQPGETAVHEFTFFLGPKSREVLARHPGIENILDYGFFGIIGKALFALLNFLHEFIPNYGVGIILMTLIVRCCLFPLNRKMQMAMARMQKLQPLIKELQEKYKDDKQRQGREMMELYRKHNANPMASCLPMFLQLPIFIALYRMLHYSIDLRQEGFIFWIKDLSRPDTIPSIALAGFPIRVLPILMVVTWILQQMMMPKPADPQQAQTQKMMMFMPIMFGFFMYSTPSGLTLYWTSSMFFGILEQRLIKWQIRRKEERGEFAAVEAEAAVPREKPRRRR
jgi:YidC/Oxa1 family membrane protein insertase